MFKHKSDYLVIIWAFDVFAMFDNIKRWSDMHWQTIQFNWQYESRNETGFFSNNTNICAFLLFIYWRMRDICVSLQSEKLCFLFALNPSIFFIRFWFVTAHKMIKPKFTHNKQTYHHICPVRISACSPIHCIRFFCCWHSSVILFYFLFVLFSCWLL